MIQYLPDHVVQHMLRLADPCDDDKIPALLDLLSLRAAVRRVHDAEDAWAASVARGDDSIYSIGKMWCEALKDLRAEMAGIDGGKEQKPC